MINHERRAGQLSAYLHAAEGAAMMAQSMANHAFSCRASALGTDAHDARAVADRLQEAADTLRMIGVPAIVKTEDAA